MPKRAEKLQKSEAEKSSRQGNLSHFNGWLDVGVTYHSRNVPPRGEGTNLAAKKRRKVGGWKLNSEVLKLKGQKPEILR